MKIAIFNENKLGIIIKSKVVDMSQAANWNSNDMETSFQRFLENFDELKHSMEAAGQTNQSCEIVESVFKITSPKY
ncbi:hypothetical protein [Pseudogracilibacillus sp. SO30301A]|uniref:hypothetical protein n=1 Tax=Pseudogracilibacillus sp. SO30301A TaxID=3098291 RepID=UPI00300DF508